MATKSIAIAPFDGESTQAKFTKKVIEEKLKDYKEYKPEKWKSIKPGDRIRYFTNNSFKSGGVVKLNNYESKKYIVVMNPYKNLSWCVQCTDVTLRIFIKPMKKVQKQKEEMQKVYEQYKRGELVSKK